MPPATRLLHTLAATTVATSLVLAGGSGHMALANGVGDLYVADPSLVLELNTGALPGQTAIDGRICVPGGRLATTAAASTAPASAATASTAASGASPAASATGASAASATTSTTACPSPSVKPPTDLAFSADTADVAKLYLASANGTPDLYRINIIDLSVQSAISMGANVTAIAHPKGNALYVALAGSKTLMYVGDNDTTSSNGAQVSKGVPDLLAADARDTHVVAAASGESWVAIIDPSGTVNYPTLPGGGKVVAAAIARDEGAAYIVTAAPNRLYRIDLVKHTVIWSPALPEAPTAVVALDHYAVVASGPKLYKVQKNGASLWATTSSDVLQLGADLDAGYVYIATKDTLLARSVAKPSANAAAIALPDGAPAALAAVPNKASNLPAVHTGATAGAGTKNSATTPGTVKPRTTHAPSTDTISDIVGGRSVDAGSLLLTLGAVVVVVTAGSRFLIKRLVDA